jgi:predicted GIY-YIG superfamily endonuclease
MFWVYVLENPRGKFYVGQTENITARIRDHNRTDCFEGHFTRKNGPWKLVWCEAHVPAVPPCRGNGKSSE